MPAFLGAITGQVAALYPFIFFLNAQKGEDAFRLFAGLLSFRPHQKLRSFPRVRSQFCSLSGALAAPVLAHIFWLSVLSAPTKSSPGNLSEGFWSRDCFYFFFFFFFVVFFSGCCALNVCLDVYHLLVKGMLGRQVTFPTKESVESSRMGTDHFGPLFTSSAHPVLTEAKWRIYDAIYQARAIPEKKKAVQHNRWGLGKICRCRMVGNEEIEIFCFYKTHPWSLEEKHQTLRKAIMWKMRVPDNFSGNM